MSDGVNKNDNIGNYRIDNKTITSKSIEYKTEITGKTHSNTHKLDAEAVFSLKYLSNFPRSLHLTLINCEIELN